MGEMSLTSTTSDAVLPADRAMNAGLNPESSRRRDKVWSVIRVSSGNFLEMYDFMVFGYYAAAIGQAFFPSSSAFSSLMLSLMTFGAGFLMRPLDCPTNVEAFVPRSRDFREIHRHAAKFHARGKTLQQSSQQNENRSEHTHHRVGRHTCDRENPDGHQHKGKQQSGTAPVPIRVRAEDDRTEQPGLGRSVRRFQK